MSSDPSSVDEEDGEILAGPAGRTLQPEGLRISPSMPKPFHELSEDSSVSPSHDESAPTRQASRSWQRKTKGIMTREVYWNKRVAKLFSDDYLELFNDSIEEFISGSMFDDVMHYFPSQYGAITWHSEEKRAFFNALARKGKDALPAIASAIGSKSELEVRDYLQILHQAFKNQQLDSSARNNALPADVPAAAEIGEECRQALDEAAEALGLYQEKYEIEAGVEKHKDLWIINSKTASWVQERFDADDEGEQEVARSLPSACLLNLGKWIELSERCYMNTGEPRADDHWRKLALKGESPSFTFTAFQDFHTLAVSITKRLLQASIFYAESRIRAHKSVTYGADRIIKHQDVITALDILGMKHNSWDYWTGITRRCSLQVVEQKHKKGAEKRILSHEEVEHILLDRPKRGKYNQSRDGRQQASEEGESSHNTAADFSGYESRAADDGMSVDGDDGQSIPDASEHSSPAASDGSLSSLLSSDSFNSTTSRVNATDKETIRREQQESEEDAYAEALDEHASRKEELDLWKILRREPPAHLSVKMEDDLPRLPKTTRRSKQELVGWRDRIVYRSEWEEHGEVVPVEEFAQNQKLGKRKRGRGCFHEG